MLHTDTIALLTIDRGNLEIGGITNTLVEFLEVKPRYYHLALVIGSDPSIFVRFYNNEYHNIIMKISCIDGKYVVEMADPRSKSIFSGQIGDFLLSVDLLGDLCIYIGFSQNYRADCNDYTLKLEMGSNPVIIISEVVLPSDTANSTIRIDCITGNMVMIRELVK